MVGDQKHMLEHSETRALNFDNVSIAAVLEPVRHESGYRMREILPAAGDPPRTPLRELSALPGPSVGGNGTLPPSPQELYPPLSALQALLLPSVPESFSEILASVCITVEKATAVNPTLEITADFRMHGQPRRRLQCLSTF